MFATALFVWLVRKLEARFPSLLVGVRADRGFCSPRLLDALDQLNVELGKVSCVLGVEKNAVLCHLTAEAKAESEETKRAARRCTGALYKAGSWSCERAVAIKVEHLLDKANPRFAVTNVLHVSPRVLYEHGYCGRGE